MLRHPSSLLALPFLLVTTTMSIAQDSEIEDTPENWCTYHLNLYLKGDTNPTVLPCAEGTYALILSHDTKCSMISKQLAAARERCTTGSVQSPRSSPATCKTPDGPAVKRTNPTTECFKAFNPNTDERCLYSFTYRLSNSGKSQVGGSVEAGSSSERCSLTQGVNIVFERWTRVVRPK